MSAARPVREVAARTRARTGRNIVIVFEFSTQLRQRLQCPFAPTLHGTQDRTAIGAPGGPSRRQASGAAPADIYGFRWSSIRLMRCRAATRRNFWSGPGCQSRSQAHTRRP